MAHSPVCPGGMSVFGIRRHPVQLYEIILGLAAVGVWWLVVKRQAAAGQPFLLAFALYSAGRLFLDAYRDNAWLTADGYHIVQIMALAVLVGCLVMLAKQTTRSAEPEPTESTPV